jgi:hypothetical protein
MACRHISSGMGDNTLGGRTWGHLRTTYTRTTPAVIRIGSCSQARDRSHSAFVYRNFLGEREKVLYNARGLNSAGSGSGAARKSYVRM